VAITPPPASSHHPGEVPSTSWSANFYRYRCWSTLLFFPFPLSPGPFVPFFEESFPELRTVKAHVLLTPRGFTKRLRLISLRPLLFSTLRGVHLLQRCWSFPVKFFFKQFRLCMPFLKFAPVPFFLSPPRNLPPLPTTRL